MSNDRESQAIFNRVTAARNLAQLGNYAPKPVSGFSKQFFFISDTQTLSTFLSGSPSATTGPTLKKMTKNLTQYLAKSPATTGLPKKSRTLPHVYIYTAKSGRRQTTNLLSLPER